MPKPKRRTQEEIDAAKKKRADEKHTSRSKTKPAPKPSSAGTSLGTYTVRRVKCKNGVVTGEIRNEKRRSRWSRQLRVRAQGSRGVNRWEPIQDATSAMIFFDAMDIDTWWPFSFTVAKRRARNTQLKITLVGLATSEHAFFIDATGDAVGPDSWYNRPGQWMGWPGGRRWGPLAKY